MNIQAEVVCDSVNLDGDRLTTFVLEYPRFVHSQMMTHRVYSRNSSSSRAIPVERMIESVIKDQVAPVHWGKNQKGMVAEKELSSQEINIAKNIWDNARENAIDSARKLAAAGVHKQIVNRVLEPFMMIRVILSGTDFDNFFNLRIAHDAQPEIQEIAIKMKSAMDASSPKLLEYYTYAHTPFLLDEERSSLQPYQRNIVSVARCARVSYKSYETGEISNFEQDVKLYNRLKEEKHMSPFEHVAFPVAGHLRYANFKGWQQLRFFLENNIKETLEQH